MLNPIHIKATSLSDAWFQTLYKCVEIGKEFVIDEGSFKGQKRLEFDFITIQITHPDTLPLLPKVNPTLGFPDPVEEGYLDNYLPYLMTGEEKFGEAYTYGQRLTKEFCENIKNSSKNSPTRNLLVKEAHYYKEDQKFLFEDKNDYFLSQMELMIHTYKNKGYRNNQMILQVGKPTDMFLIDPPCLRHIDTRIQNNLKKEEVNIRNLFKEAYGEFPKPNSNIEEMKEDIVFCSANKEKVKQRIKDCEVMELHFFPYFRSWDLYGGFPANLAAIELMKQYCAEEIGVGNGEIIASSKGLHIYDYVFEIAEAIRGRSIEEFKK